MQHHTESLFLRFWGVRGSIPAPGKDFVRYGGETTCLEVRAGERTLIVDCGSGIRALGNKLEADGVREVDVLLSHTHLDHIYGLPFFRLAYDPNCSVRFFAGHLEDGRGLREVLERIMTPTLYPVALEELLGSAFETFRGGGQLTLAPDLTIDTMRLNHPGGCIGYRITRGGRSVCIITDHEHGNAMIDAELHTFVRGADVMIYDAMFDDSEYARYEGWGHSTWQKGLKLAIEADVRTPILTHHDPSRTDEDLDRLSEEIARQHPGAIVAWEGLEVSI
ncbi:MAG: MBL fold metallo-hydrolase [Hyphomicrobiales bacterium]|nr:MAG: MBL fold metallo-hydrolase [Hyphomicrobiales bacterium]